ncbi:antitoxin VbhA family protein [Cereibacter changlensis]|uniref:antitoxin VbhA family protein n=1 Tax=Cereibacter changlensis TaxID=402884 RepID=UPI0040344637
MLASAVASQRIEGLELDAQSKRDFHALEGGELSASELRARLLSRYSKTGASR